MHLVKKLLLTQQFTQICQLLFTQSYDDGQQLLANVSRSRGRGFESRFVQGFLLLLHFPSLLQLCPNSESSRRCLFNCCAKSSLKRDTKLCWLGQNSLPRTKCDQKASHDAIDRVWQVLHRLFPGGHRRQRGRRQVEHDPAILQRKLHPELQKDHRRWLPWKTHHVSGWRKFFDTLRKKCVYREEMIF